MRKSLRLKFTLLACLVGLPSIVRAECFEDRRTVTFDQGGSVQFRSYGCQVDGGSLRVEFHRIGALAASLLFADKTSAGLEKAIGRPRLIANEVSATFLSLLQQFGSATASKDKYIAFSAEAGGAGGSVDRVPDAVAWDSAKVFGGGGFYPAIEDGDALRAKIIPRGMKYFYSVACSDDNTDTSRPTCNNIDSNLTRIKFWRSMGESDVTDYSRRMRSYNARYMPQDFKLPLEIPPALQLVSYLADGRWPDDFVILVGSGFDDGCDSGFAYSMPVVMLEVALVENVSDRPLTIDSVSGGRAAESRLRLASASASNLLATSGTTLSSSIGTLAVGEKVLLPLKIILGPDQSMADTFGYRQTASYLYRRQGLNGFSGGGGGFVAPSFKTYVYGPEFAVGGMSVNGNRVDLTKRSANFMEMTMSAEEGSCPYLLAWDGRRGDWIDYGKVLHKAPNRDRKYTEVKVFEGFRGRFRLEEREPEIAFIDQVALTVVSNSGDIVTLKPVSSRLAEQDDDIVRIGWGDSIEIEFALPKGIPVGEVKESRLAVTGYYVRYSNMEDRAGADSATRFDRARKSTALTTTTRPGN